MSAIHRSELKSEIVKMSPSLAKQYVALAGPNRFTQPIRVKFFEEIISDGYWKTTHQGIAFTSDGKLADGLHRCTAISNGKTTVNIMVTRGLALDAIEAVDLGKSRSAQDIINIRQKTPEKVSAGFIAVARAMVESLSGSSSDRISMQRQIQLVVQHFDAIAFVQEHGPRLRAVIKAPVARAWYTQNRERLREFLEVAKSGVSTSTRDTAASVLVLRFANDHSRLGSTERAIWYRRTEAALQAFLKGKSIKKLYEIKTELYPIPETIEEDHGTPSFL